MLCPLNSEHFVKGVPAEARGGAAPAEPLRPARPVASGRSPSGVVRVLDCKSNKRRPPAFKLFFVVRLATFWPLPSLAAQKRGSGIHMKSKKKKSWKSPSAPQARFFETY